MDVIGAFFEENLGLLQGNAKRKPRRLAASRELGELHGARLVRDAAKLLGSKRRPGSSLEPARFLGIDVGS
jgi:hypothetical protein